jgi:cytochrome c-type biogenesis protein CcmH
MAALDAAPFAAMIPPMTETTASGRRLQPATIALAAAALIATGVLAYTLGVRHGEGGTATDSNSSAAATNAAAGADPSQEAAIAAAEARIRQLQEALRRDPDNHQAWFELGQLNLQFEQFSDAAAAFRRAMELQPNNSSYQNYLGLAQLFVATRGHQPLTEAERHFRRALELEPGNAMSRFYLATIKDNRGDHRGALDDLIALLRDPPNGEPLPPQVRQAAIALAQQNHIDISGRLPAPAGTPDASGGGSGADLATAGIPGPTPDQLRAAGGMTPTQQSEMGRGMVDRLAGRLRQNPRDARGWIMLMRSRMALNEPQLAAEALRTARTTFQNDSATQAQLSQAAQALGVPGA